MLEHSDSESPHFVQEIQESFRTNFEEANVKRDSLVFMCEEVGSLFRR